MAKWRQNGTSVENLDFSECDVYTMQTFVDFGAPLGHAVKRACVVDANPGIWRSAISFYMEILNFSLLMCVTREMK